MFKIETFSTNEARLRGDCIMFHHGTIACHNHYACDRCELGDRLRKNILHKAMMFTYRDALPQTEKGCHNFCDMPLILTPDAMTRLRLNHDLINQIMVAYPSPGCFRSNPAGEIDGYLLNRPGMKVTVSRKEVFGVPNPRAVERYDQLYRLRLSRFFKRR